MTFLEFRDAVKSLGGQMGQCASCAGMTLGFLPYETTKDQLHFAPVCKDCDHADEYPRLA